MKYKIIVDKQSSTNPSNEKREYEIDIEELRVKGDVYDSLIITKDEDYVMRRLALSEYQILSVLEEPIKQPLKDINIELFEGDNYIYLMDMTGNRFYAEYLVKNDFTDIYCTRNEMNSAINQSASQIELSVNQKLIGYSTTEEMNALIKLLSNEIALEIAKKVNDEDLTGASIILRINDEVSEITINADKIDITGKKVSFKTEISSSYTYSSTDLNNIKKYIMEELTLTSAQQELYDIDKDGKVTAGDYVKIKNMVGTSGGKATINGTFQIDPDSASRSLILRDSNGNIITSIGLLGMQTQSFNSQYINADTGIITNLTVDGIFTNNSDKRLKNNIKKINDNYINLLKEINTVTFKYNKDTKNKTHIGFIAQEVEEAFKNNNIEASPVYIDESGIYSLEYIQFIGILWKIVQNLTKRMEKLEQKNENLEKRIKELEAK